MKLCSYEVACVTHVTHSSCSSYNYEVQVMCMIDKFYKAD